MGARDEALRRHTLWEPHIHSFAALCPPMPCPAGPLSGLTVGVKDIIDVAGMPTRNGSATCADAPPAGADADVVAALRAAGACIFGKTVTTEFALTDPTSCRNPHDPHRSPGGSSSGSGAAVGAGVVDIALGTQTAGSLCRPSAYCGAVGLKPSAGLLSRKGVTPLAPSFDTVGIMARSVDLVGRALGAMAILPSVPAPVALTCGLWDAGVAPAPSAAEALTEAADALELARDGVLPAPVDAVVAAHRIVMVAEAAAAHGALMAKEDLLRPNFAAALRAGADVTAAEVSEARAFLVRETVRFWEGLGPVDAVLTLPAPDGAPLMDGTTGFQHWLTPWTVFGGPLISLPWGRDDLGRPRAVMLAGRPGGDAGLLALAARLQALAPPLPAPGPPV